jgi:hypothetical protein
MVKTWFYKRRVRGSGIQRIITLAHHSPGSPKAQLSFVPKAGFEAQGFTREKVGPIVLPFGIWDTLRGRGAWRWARQELQHE